MSNWEIRKKRIDDIRSRSEKPDYMYSYCRVLHCGKPARAGTGDGVDTRFCRVHADHFQRHGSAIKGSYSAKALNPYRQAALVWLMKSEDEFWVKDAVKKVNGLMDWAGTPVPAFRLSGLNPKERANACWARLKAAGVDPRVPAAAWVAVEMVLLDDLEPVLTNEFKRVQAAKIVHRMASGTHKKWEQEIAHRFHPQFHSGTNVIEKHWYPKSRGRVLRHIGEALEKAVELLVDHHLAEIRAFKLERDKVGAYTSSPYPKGFSARKKASP